MCVCAYVCMHTNKQKPGTIKALYKRVHMFTYNQLLLLIVNLTGHVLELFTACLLNHLITNIKTAF